MHPDIPARMDKLDALLEQTNIEPNRVFAGGGTPLHMAAFHGLSKEAARLLQNYKTDSDAICDGLYGSPLATAVLLCLADSDAKLEIVQTLAAEGANLVRPGTNNETGDCPRDLGLFLRQENLEGADPRREAALAQAMEQGWGDHDGQKTSKTNT